jgi:hypothetical protein
VRPIRTAASSPLLTSSCRVRTDSASAAAASRVVSNTGGTADAPPEARPRPPLPSRDGRDGWGPGGGRRGEMASDTKPMPAGAPFPRRSPTGERRKNGQGTPGERLHAAAAPIDAEHRGRSTAVLWPFGQRSDGVPLAFRAGPWIALSCRGWTPLWGYSARAQRAAEASQRLPPPRVPRLREVSHDRGDRRAMATPAQDVIEEGAILA